MRTCWSVSREVRHLWNDSVNTAPLSLPSHAATLRGSQKPTDPVTPADGRWLSPLRPPSPRGLSVSICQRILARRPPLALGLHRDTLRWLKAARDNAAKSSRVGAAPAAFSSQTLPFLQTAEGKLSGALFEDVAPGASAG